MKIKSILMQEIGEAIREELTIFICGMARGVDIWAAELVLKVKRQNPKIKLICAIPYKNFEKNWSAQWKRRYSNTLAEADSIKVFYPSFHYAAFQERNCWMVDHSVRLIAVYHEKRVGRKIPF